MKILGMGMPELLIILAVILGSSSGRRTSRSSAGAIGKTVKNLREGMGGGDKNIVEADDEEEVIEEVEEPVKKTTAAKKTTTAARRKPSSFTFVWFAVCAVARRSAHTRFFHIRYR